MIFKYHGQFDLGDPVLGMKNFEARQSQLKLAYGFTCQCDLCKEEKITNDNEKYEKFEKLKIKAKELQEMSNGTFPLLENVKQEILCYKEMYKLAKEKKASRLIILKEIMDKGFDAALQGYLSSVKSQSSENCPPTGYLMSEW